MTTSGNEDGRAVAAASPRRPWIRIGLIVVLIAIIVALVWGIADRRGRRTALAVKAEATERRLVEARNRLLADDCRRAGRIAFTGGDATQRRCAGPDGRLYPAPAPTDEEAAAIMPLYRQVFADRLAAHGLPPMLPPAAPKAATKP